MKTARPVKNLKDEYLAEKDAESSLQQDDDLYNWSRKKPRTILEAVQWSILSRGTGKYTQFTDSVYNLPLYLAQLSLVSFDFQQVFENVIVLDTMRYMSDHHCATYLITFQATLSSDYDHERINDDESSINLRKIDNVQTFQTKIFVSPLDPTTRIHIEFVRIKLSEFHYYWELTRENLDEFLPTHTQPGICHVSRQYFEEEEKEEEEKLSDKDTEEKPKVYSEFHNHFLPKSDDHQEPNDFWDRVERELEKEYEDGSDLSNQLEQYEIDVEKSDGFDVGVYPLATGGMIIGNWVLRYYDIADGDRDLYTADLNRLVYLSQLAICVYNMKEVKDFDNVKVLMAMSFGTGGKDLNITFEASSPSGIALTFQTRIHKRIASLDKVIEIVFVRIKPT